METSILQADGLVKIYNKKRVVNDVTFLIERGQSVGLLGPNGAGKTTIFYMICGFTPPSAGKVYLDDDDITHLAMHRRAEKGVIYLPQESSIFKKLTVRNNLLAVLELRKDLTKQQRYELADQLLEDFNLTQLAHQYGYSLSGGERRRTEIARALALEPKFLLLDEPFAAIDPKAVADIKVIIGRLIKEKNIGILLTDHNERAALEATTLSYIIYQGQIITAGSAEELVRNELANKYYLNNPME